MAAYRDEAQEQVIWTFSADDGATYDPGVYFHKSKSCSICETNESNLE